MDKGAYRKKEEAACMELQRISFSSPSVSPSYGAVSALNQKLGAKGPGGSSSQVKQCENMIHTPQARLIYTPLKIGAKG